jgi:hypothetical protein
MANIKGSSLTRLTTVPDNTDMVIIVPDGVGGFDDWKCSKEDFLKEVVDDITELQEATQSGFELTTYYTGKEATFTHTIAANTKIYSIDIIWVAGSLDVKIGTSVAGEEIMLETEILNHLVVPINMIYTSATTYYITLGSTGTATFVINYKLF